MTTSQESFAALWDFEREVQSGTMTMAEANRHCRSLRRQRTEVLVQQGYVVTRWTLYNQSRKYWSWNEPCGLRCPTYMLDYSPSTGKAIVNV